MTLQIVAKAKLASSITFILLASFTIVTYDHQNMFIIQATGLPCLPACLPVYLPACLPFLKLCLCFPSPVSMSVHLFPHLPFYLSVCPSFHLSPCPIICPPISASVCLSSGMSACSSVRPHMSVSLSFSCIDPV